MTLNLTNAGEDASFIIFARRYRKQSFHSNTRFSPFMIYVLFVSPSRLAALVSSFFIPIYY